MKITKTGALEALRTAFSKVLNEDIPPLTSEMSLFEDLYLDSTTMLETLMELEDMLGFRVDPNSLEVEDFLTVKSFVTFLETVTQQPK